MEALQGIKTLKTIIRKEVDKMTKAEMLKTIEKSNIVVDFDYNYLMHKSKEYIISLYERAIVLMTR